MKLVLYPAVDAPRLARIVAATHGGQVVNAIDESAAEQAVAEADAFFGKLTPRLLASACRLRWVQSPTASLEHYLFPELIAHPCVLTNMRGLFSDVIAEQVLGYLLCFARNLHIYIRQRRWEPVGGEEARSGFASGPAAVSSIDRAHVPLAGQTLAIVGLGQIGVEIARRAAAFGMKLMAIDPHTREVPGLAVECHGPDKLDDALAEADFVVIAAPHTPRTARLFDRERIRRMKRSAYLVNIGRGAIVVGDDLVAALRAGEIAGAALDVFDIEPIPPDHPLWQMDNVIITPHIAGFAPSIAERHLAVLLDNVRRFAEGRELVNVVNKAEWH